MTETKSSSPRNLPIDIMKGLLITNVAGMHTIGYTGIGNALFANLWDFLSMVTFSGFVFCMLNLLVFEGFMLVAGIPSRFPPSFFWVFCSMGGILVWYWDSIRLAAWRPTAVIFGAMSANSLIFLVVTNIIVFGLGRGLGHSLGSLEVILLATSVIAGTYFLMTIVRRQKV